jgi:hypothetical protein
MQAVSIHPACSGLSKWGVYVCHEKKEVASG